MANDLIKLVGFTFTAYVIASGWRTFKDDNLIRKMNEIWNNQIEVEYTGDETEEEKLQIRKAALEKDPTYRELRTKLENLYKRYGDEQECIDGHLPWNLIKDWKDWAKDETNKLPDIDDAFAGWIEEQDDILSIYRGKIEKIDLSVQYKLKTTAFRDFRRKVRVGNLSIVDYGEILRKEGDTDDKNIRIVYTHEYINYFANDLEKIDNSIQPTIEITDKGIVLTKIINIYQDSFDVLQPPDLSSETETIQKGFIFKDDPNRTEDDFYKAALAASTTNSTRTGITLEYAKTHNPSKNAVSFFQSENYYNAHSADFINTYKDILRGDRPNTLQIAFALWCRDMYYNTSENIFDSGELNQIKQFFDNSFGGKFSMETNTIIRVNNCEFADRTTKSTYTDFVLNSVDWPEDPCDIEKVLDKLPSVGGNVKGPTGKVMSKKELEKQKKLIFDGEKDLPEIKEGNISAEEDTTCTVYDWTSIQEYSKEELEELEGQDVSQSSSDKGISVSRDQRKYSASKAIAVSLLKNCIKKEEPIPSELLQLAGIEVGYFEEGPEI